MSKLANLKKKAADLEQKRLFDRALAVYEEVLEEQEGAEEADIGLFNRVGDLHLRQGNAEAALKRYEQAVDLYVERGFHNNAVALCNKILRQDPNRAEIHFRLGQISCEKGFRSEARRHFQEYTSRLVRDGLLERALTTLGAFADQNEQLDDARQILVDILLTHGRVDKAVVQLARLHGLHESHQRRGEAQAVLTQILGLDPDFEVAHTVVSDADRDDSGSTAAADVPWSQRSYAPPELVLFDPTGPITTSRSTPPTARPAAEVTPRLQEDDIVLFDLDPVVPEESTGALPDGLTRGSDYELSDILPTTDAEENDSNPLDFEPTSVDFVAPPVEPMEGLDDGDDSTVLTTEDTVAPVELAPSWQSEAGGWEIPAGSDDNDTRGELYLTLPADETELVFITDVDPAASSDLAEELFTLPDLAMNDQAQTLDDATSPPGGWELTSEYDSDEELSTTQVIGSAADVELFEDPELVGIVDPFDGMYEPDTVDQPSVIYEPDVGVEPHALHQPEAGVDSSALHHADTSDDSLILYQAESGDDFTALQHDGCGESEGIYQVHAGDDSSVLHEPNSTAEPDVLYRAPADYSAVLHQPDGRAEPDVFYRPETGNDTTALHQPDARAESEVFDHHDAGNDKTALHQFDALAESDVLHQIDAGNDSSDVRRSDAHAESFILPQSVASDESQSVLQRESDGEWSALHQLEAPVEGEAVYELDGRDETSALQQLDAAAEWSSIYQLDAPTGLAAPDSYDAADYLAGSCVPEDSGGLDRLNHKEAGTELDVVNRLDDTGRFDGGDQSHTVTAPDAAEHLVVVQSIKSPEHPGSENEEDSGIDESTELLGMPYAIQLSEVSEPADAIQPYSAREPSGVIDPSDVIQPSAALEPSDCIQFSDAIELPEGRLGFGSSELVVPTGAADTIMPAANAVGESVRPEVVEGVESRRASTIGWTPAPVVPEPAEDMFVNLGDWLREDDEPRSTRMVVEERAPSGDEQADFAEMLRKFKQGVADNVDEDDHASHYDLGIAFREMGLMDEAIAAFQRALRGTAQRVRSFEALGQCFIDKEQYAVATSVLQRSLQEPGGDDGRLVGVLYLLGRSAEAQNQRTEALGYYQRVFAVDIEFGDVADRIGAVERVFL